MAISGKEPDPSKKPSLPASLSIGNFLEPMMIKTAAQLEKLIASYVQKLGDISFIDTEKNAIRVINIVSSLKDILNNTRTRALVMQLSEASRKQFDDILLMVMTPESLPYTHYESRATEPRLRKLAFEILMQSQATDKRTHNSRLSFVELVHDVTFPLLRSPHVNEETKQALVQALLDQPRVAEFAPHLAHELQALDKTPSHTDFDGRPYPNHWARDSLITLSDIVRPDLTGLRSGGTKPTRAPR